MIIGLRGGHSKNVIGAVGKVNEYEQMQKFYIVVRDVLIKYGHKVIDCNSNAATQSGELKEGADKANNANVDLFISLHMNSFDGVANGHECLVSSANSTAYKYAQSLVNNFVGLGFKNRGVKFQKLYEMNNIRAGNIIFELCFCDSQVDIDIYNKYTWEQLAYAFCNAIDSNIPKTPQSESKDYYVVSDYLPSAYSGYNGVDISKHLELFTGVKMYARGNNKGVWLESEYLTRTKCEELKNKMGKLFYSIVSK